MTRNSSRTIVSLSTSTVTLTDLTINAPGMYVLNIRLVSTNNEHKLTLISNGILVKSNDNDDSFVREANDLSSSIIFKGDYDALDASNQLELKRAMIYNYLLSIGMPLISDIVLIQGDVIALFQVGSLPLDISKAVTSVLSNLNVVPDLTVSSINVDGRAYSVPTGGSSSNTESSTWNKTGLIGGLVIGLLVVILLILGGIWFRHRNQSKNHAHSPPVKFNTDEDIFHQKMDLVLNELTLNNS